MDQFGCDKGFKHQYHTVYADIIESVYKEHGHVNLLELGVWKGASTLAFLKYMSDCEIPFTITGVDLFERCEIDWVSRQLTKQCAQQGIGIDPRTINMIRGNSQNPTPELVSSVHDMGINLIIDDAQHTPRANRLTLESFWDILLPKGLFVIEDVWPLDEMSDDEKRHSWLLKHSNDYTDEEYDLFIESVQDKDPHFTEIDLRKTHPDSYMVKLEKAVSLC